MSGETNLIWIDLEMTGLDPKVDRIIEIATIITDLNLNVIAEGPCLAIYQPDEVLAIMDEWNVTHHGASGLTKRVKESKITEVIAIKQTLDFFALHVPKGISPMCGNSVGQDRRFLNKYMPDVEDYFHYRNIDVSSIKELAKRWKPEVYKGFKKKNEHLALADIKESIAELQYYREKFFLF